MNDMIYLIFKNLQHITVIIIELLIRMDKAAHILIYN